MSLRKFFKKVVGVILLILTISCRNDSITKEILPSVDPKQVNYECLNIIYFVPKGSKPVDGYSERLNDILQDGQKFYAKWMKHWGYGDRTFNLDKDINNKVKIILIEGEETKDFYVYDISGKRGVDKKIKKEVSDYFNTHPNEKKGNHNLVILPARIEPSVIDHHGGVPFYGSSKWSFTMDFPGLNIENLGKTGVRGKLASYCIGGLLHELGHGIDLYHNAGRSDERKPYGYGLMGLGSSFYGSRIPTYLTSADAAILSVNPVMNSQKRSDWEVNSNFNLPKISISIKDSAIVLSGQFLTGKEVKTIAVNFHPLQNDQDIQGYKSLGIGEKYENTNHNGKFSIIMPMQGFYGGQWADGERYRITIRFCHENGYIYSKAFDSNLSRNTTKTIVFPTRKNVMEDAIYE
ncbi:hypothetical protein [Elizabethkingia bruuniana]|uniref:hypothetical protein n=1 Tax=Elizabethkingia bruuniana TaxID=1756149 RepID=UPI00241FC68F|nr:hypothetical protein [Elizabethkingia bruuniana]